MIYEDLYLAALIPPSNVTAEISAYQHRIFREFGSLSGLFIDPHIPLFFSTSLLSKDMFTEPIVQTVPYTTTEVHCSGNEIYLGVDMGGQWDALRAPASDRERPGPYSPYPGILLFSRSLESELYADPPDFRRPDTLQWSTSELVCLGVTLIKKSPGRYGAVLYEKMWTLNLRKARF